MDNILEVKGLVKRYPAFSLNSISFFLPERCVTGFIGANGGGKTTTIRSILNLARKDARAVKLFGLDADKHEQEIKDRIGIVMDGGCFYNDLSMKDMKSIIAPACSKWSDDDYRLYMKKFGLDPPVRSHFLEIIMDYMNNGGKGVFFSTHITSDLDKISDMLILIDGGRIIFQQSKDDLLDTFRATQIQGIETFVFLYRVILRELSFMQAVATEEEKSSKATALLCAAPYPRKSYVIAKYISYLVFYGGCFAVYSIVATVYPGLGFLNIGGALVVFLVWGNPLWDIHSCSDKVGDNKGSHCVYCCNIAYIAWTDPHCSDVSS